MVAVETKFGWILSGCVDVGGKRQSVNFVSSATSEVRIGGENDELESQVKRFWELESLGINKYEQSFYEEYLNTIVATNITGMKFDYHSRKIIH